MHFVYELVTTWLDGGPLRTEYVFHLCAAQGLPQSGT